MRTISICFREQFPTCRVSRGRTALVAALLVAGCSGGGGTSGHLVYVTNEDSNELTIVSVATNEPVASMAVGKRPRGVRVSEDGANVYVALSGSPKCPPTMPDAECAKLEVDKSADGIAVIDAARLTIRRVLPGGSDPEQFAIRPDQTRLYVSNEDSHQATIVDVATGEVIETINVGREPEGVALRPDGAVFYVTGETDGNITVVDAASGAVVTQIPVGRRPRDVIFAPDGQSAFVSNELDSSISMIDATHHRRARTIRLAADSKPMGLALSPDNARLYVAEGRAKTVSAIDLATYAVVATVEVGPRPWGIAITPDGTRLYTANGPSDDVSVIDTATFRVITRIPAGETPWGVAIGKAP